MNWVDEEQDIIWIKPYKDKEFGETDKKRHRGPSPKGPRARESKSPRLETAGTYQTRAQMAPTVPNRITTGRRLRLYILFTNMYGGGRPAEEHDDEQ